MLHWSAPEVKGMAPKARWGHSATVMGDVMVVMAGRGAQDLGDVHVLFMGAPAPLLPPLPPPSPPS